MQPIVVSYSELDTFRQCPLKHALAYKQRWQKPPEQMSALSKGSLWHLVMEAHYTQIKAAQDAHEVDLRANVKGRSAGWYQTRAMARVADGAAEVLKSARAAVMPLLHDQGQQSEVQELIEWMYDGYVQQYGVDPEWRILEVEGRRELPLYDLGGRRSRFRLKSKLDLVVVNYAMDGAVWVVDHKSGRNLDQQKEIDLDDQFGLYVYLLRRSGVHVESALRNGARTQRNKGPMLLSDRFKRQSMYRTEVELEAIARDAYLAARAAYSKAMDLPYSSPNPDQCSWKCDFREVHVNARKGMPLQRLLTGAGFEQNFERH